ncbi:MAG: Ig-like domain-containing protein [Clostridiales Family XIII bacterium]|jgi:hypothetical protein|nr:Ig-like domain-containing protein [Clostridiales Family XIII bacterium]
MGKRLLAAVIAFAMAFGLFAGVGQAHAASEPVAGDTVYFGRYPQGLIGTDMPTTEQNGVEWVEQRVNTYKDTDGRMSYSEDYTKAYGDPSDGTLAYYRIEPIAWRVLKKQGNKLFLMSKDALDAKPFHINRSPVTWETSTVRSWLNGYEGLEAGDSAGHPYPDSFIGTAFTQDERSAIAVTDVVAETRTSDGYYINNGKDTKDKVYLLSYEEAISSEYGFMTDRVKEDSLKQAQSTPFARARGAFARTEDSVNPDAYSSYSACKGNALWWLRSMGLPYNNNTPVTYATFDGSLKIHGATMDWQDFSVRPVLNLDMNSVTLTPSGDGAWSATTPDTPHSHVWGDWSVVLNPTQTAEGREERACSTCDKKESRPIAKLAGPAVPTEQPGTPSSPITPTVRISDAAATAVAQGVARIRTPLKTIYLTKGRSYKLRYVLDGPSGKPVNDPSLAILANKSLKSGKKAMAKISSIRKGSAGIYNIKAKRVGKFTITIKAQSGKTLKVKVVVQKKKVALKKFKVKLPKKLKKGRSYQIRISNLTKKASNISAVTFKSSKKSVAKVDQAGKVTALKKGKTKITVKVGNKRKVIKVTVR